MPMEEFEKLIDEAREEAGRISLKVISRSWMVLVGV